MKTALRAIGYAVITAAGLAALLTVWLVVFFGAAEIAVLAGVPTRNAPLYGFLVWGIITCGAIGTIIAVDQQSKEVGDERAA